MQETAIKQTMADVAAVRKAQKLPARTFTQAYAAEGLDASVEYDYTITGSLTSSRRKPRYPARNMFPVVNLSAEPRRYYWHESPALPGSAAAGPAVAEAGIRPELTHRFGCSPVPSLIPTTAWVQVPPDLLTDTAAFESFINYRLIVRLSTAENHTIIRGDGGLLGMAGIARLSDGGPFGSTILAACCEAEQQGGTADGLIINPADYYRLMATGRLMDDVERNGVFIVRTRLVDPGTAIVGDFGHGAQLFDAGRSVIRFAEPPPGTFADTLAAGGVALMAEIYVRAVVNLPANFFVVTL